MFNREKAGEHDVQSRDTASPFTEDGDLLLTKTFTDGLCIVLRTRAFRMVFHQRIFVSGKRYTTKQVVLQISGVHRLGEVVILDFYEKDMDSNASTPTIMCLTTTVCREFCELPSAFTSSLALGPPSIQKRECVEIVGGNLDDQKPEINLLQPLQNQNQKRKGISLSSFCSHIVQHAAEEPSAE